MISKLFEEERNNESNLFKRKSHDRDRKAYEAA
jgi:hypothetical protein